MTIRSKHNNLLNYFLYDNRELSPGYVRSCEKFFKSLKLQAASNKPQASSLTGPKLSGSSSRIIKEKVCKQLKQN